MQTVIQRSRVVTIIAIKSDIDLPNNELKTYSYPKNNFQIQFVLYQNRAKH